MLRSLWLLILLGLMARAASADDAACTKKHEAKACFESGLDLESKDLAMAADRYQRACDGKYARGCNNLGLLLHKNQKLQKEAAAYKSGCDLKNAMSCYNLAAMYEQGEGVPTSIEQSTVLMTAACGLGFADGCEMAGKHHEDAATAQAGTDPAAANASYAKSRDLFQRACELGHGVGCMHVALQLAAGLGVPRDDAKAVPFYAKACDLRYLDACGNLGVMYLQGTSVAKDERRAAAMFKRMCDHDVARGCATLASLYDAGTGVAEDLDRAKELFQKACDGKRGKACTRLGLLLTEGAHRDAARSKQLLQRGCELDDGEGCFELGKLTGGSAELTAKACKLGYKPACGASP